MRPMPAYSRSDLTAIPVRRDSSPIVMWPTGAACSAAPNGFLMLSSPDAPRLDRLTRVGLDRHPELRRWRIADRDLLEVKRADNGISARIFHLLIPIGA